MKVFMKLYPSSDRDFFKNFSSSTQCLVASRTFVPTPARSTRLILLVLVVLKHLVEAPCAHIVFDQLFIRFEQSRKLQTNYTLLQDSIMKESMTCDLEL